MRVLLLAWLPLLATPANAQAEDVRFELGFDGAVVAGAWNPLRLVVRDQPAVDLDLHIDQGTLRRGPIPFRYSERLPASNGLQVFEDDIFVPPWRSLSWTVRSSGRILASGSLDPRLHNPQPLVLLLSGRPARWLPYLPADSRAREVSGSSLPSRAAAYQGVAAILIDGTAAAPSTASIATAAAAGVVVLLLGTGPLPPSHSELIGLAGNGPRRIGTGWIGDSSASELEGTLSGLTRFPAQEATSRLLSEESVEQLSVLSRLAITGAGVLYAVVALLLIRFGGSAGLPAAMVTGALVAAAAWLVLRPPQPQLIEERTLLVSAAGLALELPGLTLRSLPGGRVALAGPMHPARPLQYRSGRSQATFQLGRWQREVLLGKPAVATSRLEWQDDHLVNRGDELLRDLVVIGLGPQPPLAAGERLLPGAQEEGLLPDSYRVLLELLPSGAALARSEGTLHIALPTQREGGA